MLALGHALPGVAASPSLADPAIGPHARDEARHAGLAIRFTPAGSPILPRSAQYARDVAARPMALSASGGVTREVFGFAPY